MRIELEIWRQDGPRARGFFESHVVEDAEPQMSLL
ncbi:MAG: succinate dehydrogenase/fumarate reductase iron-sulfur subunit, partial [Cutibacterium granulosum]|nr:succinate dehydrogenase/fumarate reductase iron-sulfur subunit [Cutibacterium granulosum]